MKIYLFTNEENIIYGYHTDSVFPEKEIPYEITSSNLIELEAKIGKVKYQNGNIIDVVLDETLTVDVARSKRARECYPIINRGQLWYDTLTETQLAELNTWYQAWLNVTETLVIPKKPSWL